MKLKMAVLMLIVFIMGAIAVKCSRDVGSREGYAPIQPINFSHRVHAGSNLIPCQYCHFAADKGRHAGIPPTELCLNCHKKIKPDSLEVKKIQAAIDNKKNIKWIRVHNLPDFVYFNHAQHVRVAKVNCQACHGPVETMDRITQVKSMNMGWCIDCHRGNEIAPPEDHKNSTGGDCARCHY